MDKKQEQKRQDSRPILDDRKARILGFNDAKDMIERVKKTGEIAEVGFRKKDGKLMAFADSDMTLDELLKTTPPTQGGDTPKDVGAEGGNTDALTASIPGDTATGADKAVDPNLAIGKSEKGGEKESTAEEAKEELAEKADPKKLIEDIKKVIEAKDIKKEIKSKGEQAIAKLEELQKAIEDATSFLKDNPAQAAAEGMEAAK